MANSTRSEQEAVFSRIHSLYLKDLRPEGAMERSLVHKMALVDFRIELLLAEEGPRAKGLERLERGFRSSMRLFLTVARRRGQRPNPPPAIQRLAAAAARFEVMPGGRAA